jgi:hypothetical protein
MPFSRLTKMRPADRGRYSNVEETKTLNESPVPDYLAAALTPRMLEVAGSLTGSV